MPPKLRRNCSCSICPDVELRKEIVSLREMLGQLEDDKQRRSLRRQQDYKLLKPNMTRKRPLDLEDFPEYRERIIGLLAVSAIIILPLSLTCGTLLST